MKVLSISKADLASRYDSMKVRDLAAFYGICLAKLYVILDEAGIPRKNKRKAESVEVRLEK